MLIPATAPKSWILTLLCVVLLSSLASAWQPQSASSYRSFTSLKVQSRQSSVLRVAVEINQDEEESFMRKRPMFKYSYDLGVEKKNQDDNPGVQEETAFWMAPDIVDKHEDEHEHECGQDKSPMFKSSYDLGVRPDDQDENPGQAETAFWNAPDPVDKGQDDECVVTDFYGNVKHASINDCTKLATDSAMMANRQLGEIVPQKPKTTRRMVARDNDSQLLRGALWHETHYEPEEEIETASSVSANSESYGNRGEGSADYDRSHSPQQSNNCPPRPAKFYPDIDMSIPESVYSEDGSVDLVWDLLRWDAYQEAQREPLLVSFLFSTILNHRSLESSLAFLLANRLQSPGMMISTQIQSMILDTLSCPIFRRSLRADMMAVRDRDPACNCLPDVFLYFKGFHALQSHRAAHCLWNSGKFVLAQFLQSQVSQVFQIDIHPNATMGSGIMLDHGTGIVIGETATVGHNCSILHHVTLGGSGKKGVVRHPSIGNGVLLGAGATVLGPIQIGEASQVGAGTLVISDLPSHCVAVGVPARIIGSFVDVTEQPSINMNQVTDDRANIARFESDGI